MKIIKNYTKGPWSINEHAEIEAYKCILGRVYCGDIFPNEHSPEGTANAKLIALAPTLYEQHFKMLEALKTVVRGYETDGMEQMGTRDEVFYKICKQTIKEAEL